MFIEVGEFASPLQEEQQKGISKMQETVEKQPRSHLSAGQSVLRIIPPLSAQGLATGTTAP